MPPLQRYYKDVRRKRRHALSKGHFIGFDPDVDADARDRFQVQEVQKFKLRHAPSSRRGVTSVGLPTGKRLEHVCEAIRNAFLLTFQRHGDRLLEKVKPAVERARLMDRQGRTEHTLFYNRSLAGNTANRAGEMIAEALAPERFSPYVIDKAVGVQWFLRVLLLTDGEPYDIVQIEYGMIADISWHTRSETSPHNQIKQTKRYCGSWLFDWNQDADFSSEEYYTEGNTASEGSFPSTWGNAGPLEKSVIRLTRPIDQFGKARKNNLRNLKRAWKQTNRTGRVADWVADKLSQSSSSTQESFLARTLDLISCLSDEYAQNQFDDISSAKSVVFQEQDGTLVYRPARGRVSKALHAAIAAGSHVYHYHQFDRHGRKRRVKQPTARRSGRKILHWSGRSKTDEKSSGSDTGSILTVSTDDDGTDHQSRQHDDTVTSQLDRSGAYNSIYTPATSQVRTASAQHRHDEDVGQDSDSVEQQIKDIDRQIEILTNQSILSPEADRSALMTELGGLVVERRDLIRKKVNLLITRAGYSSHMSQYDPGTLYSDGQSKLTQPLSDRHYSSARSVTFAPSGRDRI